MRGLVAHGSRMGGTAGIAEMIGSRLADAGMQVEVRPASEVSDLADYEAYADWFPASATAKTKAGG